MSSMDSWTTISAPPEAAAPCPLTVRAQSIPPHARFPSHAHEWAQVVYATTGTLSVVLDQQSFVISPEQAAWLPPGEAHQVGSILGAEFRSLWIARDAVCSTMRHALVFQVTPLLRALIVEAAELDFVEGEHGYADRVTQLILDQLARVTPLPRALPWPRSEPLMRLCETLHDDPADPRSLVEWSGVLHMSARTLSRRFEVETGLSFRSWQRRLRLFRAVEMLQDTSEITQVALGLGYGSASAFIYAFRKEFGASPKAFIRGRGSSGPVDLSSSQPAFGVSASSA